MPQSKDHPVLSGRRALAMALAALLAACQPSERVLADAGATPVSSVSATDQPRAKPAPATNPAKPIPTKPGPVAGPAQPAPTPLGGADANTLVLSVGEQSTIAGDRQLRLLRIVADSRCPKDVQCVWAGEVTLEFELKAGRDTTRFELAQARNPRASVKGLEIELRDFGPCPPGQGRMADAECARVAISTPA